MMVSNRNLLFQGVSFRCHVSFREGNSAKIFFLKTSRCNVLKEEAMFGRRSSTFKPSLVVTFCTQLIWNIDTLPETKIGPENRPFQKESSLIIINCQGPADTFRGG